MPRAEPAGCGLADAARTQRPIANRAMLALLNAKWLPPETRQQAPQPLLELDGRLPAQQLPGSGDVGLANLGIVDGECLVDDLALRRGHSDDCLRKLQNRELLGVADVDREMLTALGEQVQTADQVVDVTEAPRLL